MNYESNERSFEYWPIWVSSTSWIMIQMKDRVVESEDIEKSS